MFDCSQLKQPVYPALDPEGERLFQQARAMAKPGGEQIDFSQAAALYAQAADKGHWKAMNNLARLYYSGQGVEEDEDKAADLILQMQQYDLPESLYALANAYEKGIGHIKKSKRKMQETLDKAAEFANPRVLGAKGRGLMLTPGREATLEAIPILECAMSMGYTDDGIVGSLSNAYLFEGRHKDYYDVLIRGANMTDITSLSKLETLFRRGLEGFPVDEKRGKCIDAEIVKYYADKSYQLPDDIRTICPANVALPYEIEGG